MAEYTVVDGHKKIGGKLHAPGDTIECDAATAFQLRLQPGQVQKEPPATGALNAAQMIEKIQACMTVEEIDALAGEDTRKTVLEAAEKRKAALAAGQA